ncbi:MAG: phospholipase D-like domain-containing protein [Candidatus Freyarchaeota archaeon]
MGVEVYVRECFHEKVIIIDGRIAYVGSANVLAWPSSSDLM